MSLFLSLLIMSDYSSTLSERINNGLTKTIRFICRLTPHRLLLFILRKSWGLPFGIQRKGIKNVTLPLLEWKPHYVKVALPGVDPSKPELLSAWIGEGIRKESLVDGWENIDRVILFIHGKV